MFISYQVAYPEVATCVIRGTVHIAELTFRRLELLKSVSFSSDVHIRAVWESLNVYTALDVIVMSITLTHISTSTDLQLLLILTNTVITL